MDSKKEIRTRFRVRQHLRQVPISKKNPDGVTSVCRHTRSRESMSSLSPGDLEQIRKAFSKNIPRPTAKSMDYPHGNDFDDLIAGWVDYFNKKFNIQPPLDPNLVKALIASESGFDVDPKQNKIAKGLGQITKKTLKIILDSKGEISEDGFNGLTEKDLLDPNINIAVTVRWLFQKKKLAGKKLKREATWAEACEEYKGILKSKTLGSERKRNTLKVKYDLLLR